MNTEFDENDFDYQQYVCSELEGELEEQEEEFESEEQDEEDEESKEEVVEQPKITKKFLSTELNKICENDRMLLHFKYNGMQYEGKVIAYLSGTKYLFNLIIPKKGLTSIDIEKIS